MYNKEYTHCIWDFNGTLLDDVDACIRAINELLLLHGARTVKSREEYKEIFKFPVRQYYEDVGFDFSVEPYESLSVKWIEKYLEYSKDARICKGADNAISFFEQKGIKQILLSATEEKMLRSQLSSMGLLNTFDEVIGRGDIYAGSKVENALAWRKRNPDAVAILIGDTEHDFESAQAIGAECFLVTSGHQSRKRLENTGAKVFDSLDELILFFKNNRNC